MTLKRRSVQLGWFLLGGVAAVILGFGIAEARTSRAVPEETCLYQPPTFLGACTSQSHCQALCNQYYAPGESFGDCDTNGCCTCIL
jgi:hypothetical protein